MSISGVIWFPKRHIFFFPQCVPLRFPVWVVAITCRVSLGLTSVKQLCTSILHNLNCLCEHYFTVEIHQRTEGTWSDGHFLAALLLLWLHTSLLSLSPLSPLYKNHWKYMKYSSTQTVIWTNKRNFGNIVKSDIAIVTRQDKVKQQRNTSHKNVQLN